MFRGICIGFCEREKKTNSMVKSILTIFAFSNMMVAVSVLVIELHLTLTFCSDNFLKIEKKSFFQANDKIRELPVFGVTFQANFKRS